MANFFIITKAVKQLFNHSHRLIDDATSTLQLVNVAGLIVHLCFIGLFYFLELPFMILVNVFSVAIWCAAIFCNLTGRLHISVMLIAFEIAAHASIASITLGLAAGFQLYLWPAVLLMCVLPATNNKTLLYAVGLTVSPLIALNWLAPYSKPEYEHFYDWVFLFNLISATVPFIMSSIFVRATFMHNYQNMENRANNDELTQLINRRRGYELLHDAYAGHKSITLALGDIDHFKRINDTLGHLQGDEVLKQIADFCTEELGELGVCCRWGGEEFLFIFINQPHNHALYKMKDICEKMPKKINLEGLPQPVTCSFGLVKVGDEEPLEPALSRVDKLLYQAKDAGRFRVITD